MMQVQVQAQIAFTGFRVWARLIKEILELSFMDFPRFELDSSNAVFWLPNLANRKCWKKELLHKL